MNFELTEEQKLIRDMVRSFAEAEVAPSARVRDEEERFDRALMYDRLGELGLTGIVFPEEYGGGGARATLAVNGVALLLLGLLPGPLLNACIGAIRQALAA